MSETAPILFTAGGEAFTSASSNGHLRVQLNAFAERVDYHQQNVLMSELTVRYAKISQMLDRRNRDLSESNATRQEAQRLAHLGNWRVNLITQTIVWSDTMYELLALDSSQKPNLDNFMARVHPDDLAMVQQATTSLMQGHAPTDLVYRLVMPGGHIHWVRAQHVPEFNEYGVATSMHGTMQDITDAKNAELALIKNNGYLEALVQEIVQEIFSAQQATIYALVKLAESRDDDTGEHIERTSQYCRRLAQLVREQSPYAAQVDDSFIENITLASPLHDIGKVGIPDHILLKPGRLTPEEFELMKTHVTIGYQTLATVEQSYPNSGYLRVGMDIARYHHEKWDGSGYREGLSGEAIPLSARIMAIGDVYDALRSRRVYKEPFPHEECVRIILGGRGQHFDPVLTDLFVANQEDFRSIFDKSRHT